jgi:hypothetical protein
MRSRPARPGAGLRRGTPVLALGCTRAWDSYFLGGSGAVIRIPARSASPRRSVPPVRKLGNAFQASAIRNRPPRRHVEVLEIEGVLKSVPNRPSQQVRRERAVGEPNSVVVLPLPVNRSGGKPWPNLGFSRRLLAAESLTSAKTGGGRDTGNKWSLPPDIPFVPLYQLGTISHPTRRGAGWGWRLPTPPATFFKARSCPRPAYATRSTAPRSPPQGPR